MVLIENSVSGVKQLLTVNKATVRRKKPENIREQEGKTDKKPTRKESENRKSRATKDQISNQRMSSPASHQ